MPLTWGKPHSNSKGDRMSTIIHQLASMVAAFARHPSVGLIAQPMQVRSQVVPTQAPSAFVASPPGAVTSPQPYELLMRAQTLDVDAPQQREEAGKLYMQARRGLMGLPKAEHSDGFRDGLRAAALGEISHSNDVASNLVALHGALDELVALDPVDVRGRAEIGLARANLDFRAGGSYETCIEMFSAVAYDESIRPDDAHLFMNRWNAAASIVNLYLHWGRECKSISDKGRAFGMAAFGALSMLEGLTDGLSGEMRDRCEGRLRFLYGHIIACLMSAGYADYAYRVYSEKLKARHPGSPEEAAAREVLAPILDESGELARPGALRRTSAVARQMLMSSAFPTNRDAFGWMLSGAVAGSVAANIFLGGDFSSLMEGAAIGATTAYVGGKAYHGAFDHAAESAWATGYTPVTGAQASIAAIAELAKLGAVYALWGGEVVPRDIADGIPVFADTSGQFAQFYGFGSVEVFVHQIVTGDVFELARLVAQDPATGFTRWWTGLLENGSAFAQVVQMGGENWMKFFDPRESKAWGTSPSEHPLWFVFEMVTLLYAVTTMKAGMRGKILDRIGHLAWKSYKLANPNGQIDEAVFKQWSGKGFEWLLLIPGILLLSKDMACYVGNMSAQAAIKAGVVSLVIYYMLNLMRGQKPWDAPGDGALRNTWIPALFASFGGAVVDGVDVNSLGDAVGVSLGLNVIYIPLIILMTLGIPLNSAQMAKQAFTRWPVFESLFTNMPRALGLFQGMAYALGLPPETVDAWFEGGKFGSAGNTVLAELIQALINEPASNRAFGAIDGTKIQEDGLISMTNVGRGEGQVKAVMDSARTGGRQWDFWQFARGENLMAVLYPFTAVWATLFGMQESFPTEPASVYWNGIYRTLNRKLSVENMDVLLNRILPKMLEAYTPETIDVYHNWFTILWASRDGVHGDRIREFFAKHDWIFDMFSILRDLPVPDWNQTFDWNFFATWHKTYLWGGNRVAELVAGRG